MKTEKTTRAVRLLSKMSLRELNEVSRYIKTRRETLQKRERQRQRDEAWERARKWAHTDTVFVSDVWVCSEATFLSGPFQRGDCLRVVWLQPRKKLLWVEFEGSEYGLSPYQINRYDLQTEPPTRPMSDGERRLAKRAGQFIAERLT